MACSAILLAGCGTTTTTPTDTAADTTTLFFTDALTASGTNTYTFNVTATSTVVVTLASVVSTTTSLPIAPTLTITLGTPSGSSCTASSSASTAPALVGQINKSLAAGTYCVSVNGAGLGEAATATLRVAMTVGAAGVSAGTTTDLFSSTLGQAGATKHSFPILAGGPLSLTLEIAGDATQTLGLGLGVFDGSVCRLNSATTTLPTGAPAISTNADAGNYCLVVTDLGTVTGQILITVGITHV